VFLDNKLQSHEGIRLLHDHFHVANSSPLVEHDLVFLPWNLGDEDKNTAPKFEGNIALRSIKLFDGKLAPFELSFSLTEHKLNIRLLTEALRVIRGLGIV
jgi:hypothetical protein